jgi:hypothetical protein
VAAAVSQSPRQQSWQSEASSVLPSPGTGRHTPDTVDSCGVTALRQQAPFGNTRVDSRWTFGNTSLVVAQTPPGRLPGTPPVRTRTAASGSCSSKYAEQVSFR